MSFVLDASVALSWCFPDEGHLAAAEARAALRRSSARVPPLWLLEVANGLLTAERRGRLPVSSARASLEDLLLLPIEIERHGDGLTARTLRILELAHVHHLSAYDAAYLELAIEARLPLATLDAALREAAPRAGVELRTPAAAQAGACRSSSRRTARRSCSTTRSGWPSSPPGRPRCPSRRAS